MGHTTRYLPFWPSSSQWAIALSSRAANNTTGFQKTPIYTKGYPWLGEGWFAEEEQAKVSQLLPRHASISNMPSCATR